MVHHEGIPQTHLKSAEAPAPLLHIVEKPVVEVEDVEGEHVSENVVENREVQDEISEEALSASVERKRQAEEDRTRQIQTLRQQLQQLTNTVPMRKRVERPPVSNSENTKKGEVPAQRYAA